MDPAETSHPRAPLVHASQVAFNLTIPCMLLVSTAKTLAAGPSLSIAAVPLVAVAHVLIGAWLGSIAAGLSSGKWAIGRALLGWQPLHPTPSAAAIAASTAAAMGAPAVSGWLASLLPAACGSRPTPATLALCTNYLP